MTNNTERKAYADFSRISPNIEFTLVGDTYPIKEELKALGARWVDTKLGNSIRKRWFIWFERKPENLDLFDKTIEALTNLGFEIILPKGYVLGE